jgi:hypothetical protein
MTNHVDGEIILPGTAPVIRAPYTDIDIRSVALTQAVQAGGGKANRAWILDAADEFETYLRDGKAAA